MRAAVGRGAVADGRAADGRSQPARPPPPLRPLPDGAARRAVRVRGERVLRGAPRRAPAALADRVPVPRAGGAQRRRRRRLHRARATDALHVPELHRRAVRRRRGRDPRQLPQLSARQQPRRAAAEHPATRRPRRRRQRLQAEGDVLPARLLHYVDVERAAEHRAKHDADAPGRVAPRRAGATRGRSDRRRVREAQQRAVRAARGQRVARLRGVRLAGDRRRHLARRHQRATGDADRRRSAPPQGVRETR